MEFASTIRFVVIKMNAREMTEEDYLSDEYVKSIGKLSSDKEMLYNGIIFLTCLDVYRSLPKSPIRSRIIWIDNHKGETVCPSVKDRMDLLLSLFHHREDITTKRVVGIDGRFGILFHQIKDSEI